MCIVKVIKKVMEFKTHLPNNPTPNLNRRVLPRRVKRKAQVTLKKNQPKKRVKKKPTPKKWTVQKFINTKPYQVQVKWKRYKSPTWEPKATMRKDLGNEVMDRMLLNIKARKKK